MSEMENIPTPLTDRLELIEESVEACKVADHSLYDFELALKGKKAKPCSKVAKNLDELEHATAQLEKTLRRCHEWLRKRKKARKA